MYANTGDRFKQKAAPRISKVKVFRIIDKTFFSERVKRTTTVSSRKNNLGTNI